MILSIVTGVLAGDLAPDSFQAWAGVLAGAGALTGVGGGAGTGGGLVGVGADGIIGAGMIIGIEILAGRSTLTIMAVDMVVTGVVEWDQGQSITYTIMEAMLEGMLGPRGKEDLARV